MSTTRSFDFVIVGGGAAGAVLANRLSASPDVSVLLIEAGPHYRADPTVSDPARWAQHQGGALDWAYHTTTQPNLADRHIPVPRGRVLGGSTAINAMLWLRGDRRDFDGWATPEWSADDLWPAFDRAENVDDTGTGLNLTRLRGQHAWSQGFVEAAIDAGHAFTPELNDGTLSGAGYYTVTHHNGARQSAWNGYLKPATDRSNLTVLTNAEAQRLTFDGERATGVEYVADGRLAVAQAQHEVLLCAGVIGSPSLLRASGIGAAASVAELGIATRVDLPGVGENLHDHIAVSVAFEAANEDPSAERSGLGEAGLFVGDDRGTRFHLWLGPSTDPAGQTLTVAAGLTRPSSRGRIHWQGDDARPDPGYLSESGDAVDLAEALSIIADLADTTALRALVKGPAPAVLTGDTATVNEYVRTTAGTQFHLVGTCRMGTDALAVVSPELRVHGVTNVRVVDASVLPDITSGGPQAPVYGIAERAAALISAHHNL